ncbi:Pim proto-oncogene, serine/threonine kinase, related 212 [Danio rerio]|uniref:non-specific serine/threonine protein kinase n=1 Tax=Danio rerio TaxID=7955 RepID=B1WB50_DANRE|nr:Pim proto-oncogene, serine/threonine kinase, related 212 precursor [Danio rerio]AAI61616.1 Si:dkeyp-110e4.3 protein [Danio rerio]|eukprot:NP_001120941.1 Pim proto-oncogene, serine/threonine kinase, related 212 precursor [Danio rerio]
MLLTVLGVIALFLRGRNANNTEEEGQNDVPPVGNSDGREIDDWCKESSLEEPVSVHSEEPSLVEPVSVHSEEPSLVEPVSVHSEEPSLVEPVSVHSEEPSLVEPVSVHSEEPSLVEPASVHSEEPSLEEPVSVHSEEPSLVEPASVHSEEPSLVEPASVHSEEPSLEEPVSVHSEEPSLVEPASVHSEEPSLVEPASVHSEEPSLVEPVSVHSEEPSLVETVSVHSKEPSLVETVSVHSEEPSLVETVSVHSEEPSLEEPSLDLSFFSAESSWSEDLSSDSVTVASSWSDDLSSGFLTAESGCGDDEPLFVFSAEPEKLMEDKVTQIIEINSHSYEIESQLGEGGCGAVFAGTRLEDGLQVAVKVCDFKEEKRFISVDGIENPLPLEIALHFLANKSPKVKEIVELLDWKVEDDNYFMVLEQPIPCMSLHEFLLDCKGIVPEDKLRKIMYQTTIAAQTCCQRGVLHRDIKLENLLINPDTLEVKLIDFGCGELLTEDSYQSFRGTREYFPPEFLTTGRYHGEPATVWSLGVVLFLLVFYRFPEQSDMPRMNNRRLRIKGLSRDCCDFFHGCLQFNYKDRLELQNLSSHKWFRTRTRRNEENCPSLTDGSSQSNTP